MNSGLRVTLMHTLGVSQFKGPYSNEALSTVHGAISHHHFLQRAACCQKASEYHRTPQRPDGETLDFGSRLESPDRICLIFEFFPGFFFFNVTSINLTQPYLKCTAECRCASDMLIASGGKYNCSARTHTRGRRHPVLEKVHGLLIIFMHSLIHMGGNTFMLHLRSTCDCVVIFRGRKKEELHPAKKNQTKKAPLGIKTKGINLMWEWEAGNRRPTRMQGGNDL